MVDELAAILGGDAPSPALPTSVVGLIIITVPAAITAIGVLVGNSRRRGRPQDETPPPLPMPVNPVNSAELDQPQGGPERRRIGVLENWLWRNRFDPTKIHDGNEAIDSVRIF